MVVRKECGISRPWHAFKILRAIRKVTSGELLTKQAMRKKMYYVQKNTYILKLLLNVVTPRIEALASRCKLLYACVKEVCCLWAQPRFDTFHQLLIIVEVPWSQPVLQVGKQVVVARSEIRAVTRVVKQLPVEMPQQWTSASSRMRTLIVMEEHYTGYQHSTPFVPNGPTQFF
jgi:hypothetical protein